MNSKYIYFWVNFTLSCKYAGFNTIFLCVCRSVRVSKKCWHMLVNLCLHILLTCAVFVGGINQTYNASVCQAVCDYQHNLYKCFLVYRQNCSTSLKFTFCECYIFIGLEESSNVCSCHVLKVGIVLHYSTLATALWSGVTARNIYKQVTRKAKRYEELDEPPPPPRPMLR